MVTKISNTNRGKNIGILNWIRRKIISNVSSTIVPMRNWLEWSHTWVRTVYFDVLVLCVLRVWVNSQQFWKMNWTQMFLNLLNPSKRDRYSDLGNVCGSFEHVQFVFRLWHARTHISYLMEAYLAWYTMPQVVNQSNSSTTSDQNMHINTQDCANIVY